MYLENNIEIAEIFSAKEYETIRIHDEAITVEALIVALADEIAQRHHDVEDALETKIMDFEELYNKIDEVYVQNTEVDKKKMFI